MTYHRGVFSGAAKPISHGYRDGTPDTLCGKYMHTGFQVLEGVAPETFEQFMINPNNCQICKRRVNKAREREQAELKQGRRDANLGVLKGLSF
jgi:hypothetical protein